MKRVLCLYRVSTVGQVDHDDIPMQRVACREFIDQNKDWELVDEVLEKGVSGYKTRTIDRDALTEIKAKATAKKFDILLVFMFDRLGRREDETPFVVQWFVENGIEVWSVKEGQQRFDTHVDKLLNYIRFWQASGESEKTSLRIRTKHLQMVQDGLYRGGLVPFGYHLEYLGRTNKKNQPVQDFVIDETESAIVKEIYYKIISEGWGANRIANWLNERNISTKRGRKDCFWRATSVRAIVRNPIYIGRIRFGDELSEPFENLRIIDDFSFNLCERIITERMFMGALKEFAKGGKGSFACALDYTSAARVGITDMEFFLKEQRRMPEAKFAMEYGSNFVGAESGSMYPYDLTESCRTLKHVEFAQPHGSSSEYVMGVDLATSSERNADNAVITVLKLVDLESGAYMKKLVYMRSYHGKRLDALAEEVRRTYVRFPRISRIVFDHRGLGDAFPQFLAQPWLDTETGKEYPPWTLDDERTIIHNAVPLLRSVKASAQINQQLVSCLRIALEQHSIELPISSRFMDTGADDDTESPEDAPKQKKLTMQEKSIFLETDALQIEMGNIVMRSGYGNTVLYDVARTNQHKDRYSSLAMAVRYVAELEDDRKKRLQRPADVCIGVVSKF